jgi:hypothetical protein
LLVNLLCIWWHHPNGSGDVVFSRYNGLFSRNESWMHVMNHLKSIRKVSDRDALKYTWLFLWNCPLSWVSLNTNFLPLNLFPPLGMKTGPLKKSTLNHVIYDPAVSIMIERISPLKEKPAGSSDTLVLVYQNTRHRALEGCRHATYSNVRISNAVHQDRYSFHSICRYWLQ